MVKSVYFHYTPTYNRDEPIVALAESLMTITPAEMKEFGVTLPPTQDELPHSDGEPIESQRYKLQIALNLLQTGMTLEQVAQMTRFEIGHLQALQE